MAGDGSKLSAVIHKLIYEYGTCNLDVHVAVQQQILRLQVPVDNVAVVTILHRRQDLPELPPGLQLTETTMLRQVVCSQTAERGDVRSERR